MNKNALLLLALGLALAACGDDKGSSNDEPDADTGLIPDVGTDTDTTPDVVDATPDVQDTTPDVVPPCDLSIAAVGPTSVIMRRSEQREISVKVTDCNGDAWEGQNVSFELVGTVGGSSLRSNRAQSGADGVATAELNSGASDANFDVEASLGDSVVTFGIRVSSTPNGDLEVTIVNGTEEDLAEYAALVFRRGTCDDIDPFDPLGAEDVIDSITSIREPVVFEALAPSDTYVVAAQGFNADGRVLGFGCQAGVLVLDRDVQSVTITLDLLPVVFTGIYTLDNEFDLAGVLPPSVEDTLRILDELTDDHAISGSTADDEWGVDPSAFILDFVYREMCCWEALDTDEGTAGIQASWDSCRAQDFTHATGDLEQLYTMDFTSWNGAQPSSTGLCGGLEFANEALQGLLQDLITTNVPEIGLRLLTMVGDLSRAVTEMNVISELTVGEVAVGKNGNFTHELKQMVVELHDLDGMLAVYTFDLADAGLTNLAYSAETTATEGNVLEIPEHSFELDFGKLLRFVFTDVLIPTLDCDADHDGTTAPCEDTADLLLTWVDCDQVATWIDDQIESFLGFSSGINFEPICILGVNAAGGAIEDALESAIDATTVITLTGTASAGEIDERREATTLVDGVWAGELREDGTSYGEFPGTFDGERTADLD